MSWWSSENCWSFFFFCWKTFHEKSTLYQEEDTLQPKAGISCPQVKQLTPSNFFPACNCSINSWTQCKCSCLIGLVWLYSSKILTLEAISVKILVISQTISHRGWLSFILPVNWRSPKAHYVMHLSKYSIFTFQTRNTATTPSNLFCKLKMTASGTPCWRHGIIKVSHFKINQCDTAMTRCFA